MGELELENTLLAKYIPDDVFSVTPTRITDIYFPQEAHHPRLRLRARDDVYTMTKKTMVDDDASSQLEQNIVLSPEEYDAFAEVEGKSLTKDRYEYSFEGALYEFDIFKEGLEGLVLIDIEFDSLALRDQFVMPDFCLVNVTYEEWLAGGMLAGKTIEEVQVYFEPYGYQPIFQ